MITGAFIELACTDKSCAPPPVGTGGSKPSGAGRAATGDAAFAMSIQSQDALRKMVMDKYPSLFKASMPDGLYESYNAVGQLRAYTGLEYEPINRSLRDDESYADSETVQLMDIAFKDHSVELTEPITVYRGMRMRHHKDNPYVLEVGDVVEDKAFMSTSTNMEQAISFTDTSADTNVLMRITVPAGQRVLAGDPSEKELILDRGTRVRVTGVNRVTKSRNGGWTQWVEGSSLNPILTVDVEVVQ